MRYYGRTSEIGQYPKNNQLVLNQSAYLLSDFFQRNAKLLKQIGLSVNAQRREIKAIYGIIISDRTMTELKQGKRFRCGLLLLTTIQHYWNVKGYDLKID